MYQSAFRPNLYFKEDFMVLCAVLSQEIIESKTPSEYNKFLVRYIGNDGAFGYVRFGDFFFIGEKLIVITPEKRYSKFHNPTYNATPFFGKKMRSDENLYFIDAMYAGVFTGFVDDNGKSIFEGDLLDVDGYYAAVSISDGDYAFILDNHSIPLYREQSMKVVGNIFYDLKLCYNDTFNIRGACNIWGVFKYGTEESVKELLAQCARAPYFATEVDSKDNANNLKSLNDASFIAHNARQMRIRTFQDTIKVVNNKGYITDRGVAVHLDDDSIPLKETLLYSQSFDVNSCDKVSDINKIELHKEDCIIVGKELLDRGYNPVVLNMANRQNPGGGVINGAAAQEESIFRRTNLFRSLYQFAPYASKYGLTQRREGYPLDRNFGGIYSPCITVFRGVERDNYPLLEEPFKLSFISVAAINRPELSAEDRMCNSCVRGTKDKMRTILRIALKHGHDSIVLGAMGCGAFKNPPNHIAQLFREVIEEPEFDKKFKLIAFAIIEDHNSHQSHNKNGNFSSFETVFRG